MQKTVDDFDGITAGETHSLAIDGYQVHVDLSEENWKLLVALVVPYFKAGRNQRGTAHPDLAAALAPAEVAAPAAPPARVDLGVSAPNDVIREWWQQNEGVKKLKLPPYKGRGIIPQAVKDAYANHRLPAETG